MPQSSAHNVLGLEVGGGTKHPALPFTFQEPRDMLRYKRHVRLTQPELQQYQLVAGEHLTPLTVEEHDRGLAMAASAWRDAECAEGTLLALIAEDLRIEK